MFGDLRLSDAVMEAICSLFTILAEQGKTQMGRSIRSL